MSAGQLTAEQLAAKQLEAEQLAKALFLESWSKADQYPLSLIKLGANIGSLRAHAKLLNANAPNLFYPKSNVNVLDFYKNEQTPGIP